MSPSVLIRSILLRSAICGFAILTAANANAGSKRYASPPPLVLSPHAAEPWIMQLQPGYRIKITDPARNTYRSNRGREIASYNRGSTRVVRKKQQGLDPRFLPQVVDYYGSEKPGTIIIDTNERHLFLVMAGKKARRYGVGVGRPGFEWSGVHKVTRKSEWPSWRPPAEMRKRQPGLPVFMEGGPNNPLGARALYLGSTLYRIHGSNAPWTIGKAVSSGCIRMRNKDVEDLYTRVGVGTRVIVI